MNHKLIDHLNSVYIHSALLSAGAGIIPLDGNAADRDCVAVIIKSETEIAFMWIDCDEIKAK